MTKIIDISLTITPEMIVWPGDPAVHVERASKIEDGDQANVTKLRMGAHTGTHMDAPFHFVADGRTIDQIRLEDLIGKVQVVAVPRHVDCITKSILEPELSDPMIDKVIFKTRNSELWENQKAGFDESYVGLSEEGAQFLIDKGITLVGIDYLSVAPFTNLIRVHQLLLKQNIIILEGLDLRQVDPGFYTLICMPLKIKGADGAPLRAALVSGTLI